MATTSFLTEVPRPMPDEILLQLTRDDLISYVYQNCFYIEDEEFKSKKVIIQEFRLFMKKKDLFLLPPEV